MIYCSDELDKMVDASIEAFENIVRADLCEGLGPNAQAVARWYCVSREGMATLCKDQEDAQANAEHCDKSWPAGGPHRAVQLLDAATTRYMVEGAWCAGYYDAGYTHDSAYACKRAEKCADEFLGPNVRANRPDTAKEN